MGKSRKRRQNDSFASAGIGGFLHATTPVKGLGYLQAKTQPILF
jgi:hypothetical protein